MAIELDIVGKLGARFREIFGGTKVELDKETEEIVDPFKTLAGLQTKADIMAKMIQKGQIEQYPIGIISWVIRRLWFANLVSDGGIEGLDNLQNAVTTARTKNKRIVFTPAHLADLDHPAAIHEMAQEKRGLGIQEEIVWMAGVNMRRRPAVSRFMRGGHVIYNVTPRDMDHLNILIEKQEEFGFGAEEAEILEGIRTVFNQMRETARARIAETCVKGKKPLTVYPEGGRAYDGWLKSSPAEFSWFFPRDESTLVVPYRVYGSRELNPPGTDPKVLRREMLPWWLGGTPKQIISMIVGEFYLSSEIWRIWRARREELGKKADINPMNWVMANIANLDPLYVRPDDLHYYGELMQRFAPERNRMKSPD